MNWKQILGLVLILGGALGLAFGGFGYDRQTTGAKLGPLELKVTERKSVQVPMVLSLGAIGVGLALVVLARR